MHELSLAHEILRICEAALARHGTGRIESVRVAVGELSAVEPDLLRYAWEALTQDGPHAGARLEIDWRPARRFCARCDAEKRRVDGRWTLLCPDCDEVLQVQGGTELDVLDLRVTLDEAEASAPAQAQDGRRASREPSSSSKE